MWSGWRTLQRMNLHTSSLRSPRLHQLADRDPQALLEHVARAGADAVAADVGVMDRRAEEGDRLAAVAEHRIQHRHVEQLARRLVRVVGDQHVALDQRSGGYSSSTAAAARASELMWPGVPVTAWATIRPRWSNTALARSPASRTIGRERGPLQRPGLLVDRGDQALPQHLELDRIEPAITLLRLGDQRAVVGDVDRPTRADDGRGLALLDDGRADQPLATPRSLRR